MRSTREVELHLETEAARRRSTVAARFAAVGLVVVLAALTAFAVGAAAVAADRGAAVADGGALSSAYQGARYDLAMLEGLRQRTVLERQHLTADRELEFQAARISLEVSMERLLLLADDPADVGAAEDLWSRSLAYLAAVDRSLAGVQGDGPLPHEGNVGQLAANLQDALEDQSRAQESRAREALAGLRTTQATVLRVTPIVFAVGLGLMSLAWSVTRTHRRRADRWSRQHEHDALHDSLTGLANRKVMATVLAGVVADARGAVMLLDLDAFKAINDTHGHAVGDEVLAEVARRLRALLPDDGTAVRLGGDEFALVLAGPTRSDAELRTLADRVVADVGRTIAVGDTHLRVRVSLGVAQPGPDVPDTSALLHRADVAMYEAKRAGGGVRLYDSGSGSGSGSASGRSAATRSPRGELCEATVRPAPPSAVSTASWAR